MDKYLKMVFKTEEDKKVSIRVTAPEEDLDAQEVKAVMDLVIQKNAIFTNSGDLVAIDSAVIVETSTTDLELE